LGVGVWRQNKFAVPTPVFIHLTKQQEQARIPAKTIKDEDKIPKKVIKNIFLECHINSFQKFDYLTFENRDLIFAQLSVVRKLSSMLFSMLKNLDQGAEKVEVSGLKLILTEGSKGPRTAFG